MSKHRTIVRSHKRHEQVVIKTVRSGLLEIDAEGRIWRIGVLRTAGHGRPSVIKPCKRRRAEHFTGDYFHVRQTIEGRRIACMAHRLVYRYFKGSIPVGYEINHKNGRKIDNWPTNLERATRSRNIRHAFKNWAE